MTPEDIRKLDGLYGAMGRITWLWCNSDLHCSWPIALQTRFVLPPVTLGQYAIVERNGVPQAYCSWARMTLDVETEYVLNPNSLKPEDWASGDRLWVIDWIAPFARRDSMGLRAELRRRFPKHIVRGLRVKPNDPKARIVTYIGAALSPDEARNIRMELDQDLANSLKAHSRHNVSFRTTKNAEANGSADHKA